MERDESEMQWYAVFNSYIDNEIMLSMVDATNRTYVLKKGKSLGPNLKEYIYFVLNFRVRRDLCVLFLVTFFDM